MMTPDQLKAEAARVRESEATQQALAEMKAGALEVLANVDATNADEIRKYQAMVRTIDEFMDLLEFYITNGESVRKSGIV